MATLLQEASRIEEAEPLMRRSLDILVSFGRQTAHEHPDFQRANESFRVLQRAMGSDEPD